MKRVSDVVNVRIDYHGTDIVSFGKIGHVTRISRFGERTTHHSLEAALQSMFTNPQSLSDILGFWIRNTTITRVHAGAMLERLVSEGAVGFDSFKLDESITTQKWLSALENAA